MAMGTNGVTGAGAVVVVGGNENVGRIATCGCGKGMRWTREAMFFSGKRIFEPTLI